MTKIHDDEALPLLAQDSLSLKKLPLRCTFAALVAGLTPLQFGYGLASINNPGRVIQEHFADEGHPLSSFHWSMIVSIFLLGGGLGSTLPSFFLKYTSGSRNLLLANSLLFVAGSVLISFSHNFYTFVAGRLLLGIGSGCGMVIAPMYISQISPVPYRGSLGSVVQLSLACGIILSEVFGLSAVFGTRDSWRIIFAVAAVPALLTLAFLPFLPHSPFDMVKYKSVESTRECLKKFRADATDLSVERELQSLLTITGKQHINTSYYDIFTTKHYRKPVIIGVALMFIQQACGRNVINFFSTDLFTKAHIPNPDLATLGCGIACIPVGIFSILVMDRFYRRTMMKAGLLGLVLSYSVLGVCNVYQGSTVMGYLGLVAIIFIVFFFGFSAGPMPPFLVCELLPSEILGKGMALAGLVNWITNFFIGFSFTYLQKLFGSYVMFFFAGLNVLFLVFVHFYMPETKGLRQAEVQRRYFIVDEDEHEEDVFEVDEDDVDRSK